MLSAVKRTRPIYGVKFKHGRYVLIEALAISDTYLTYRFYPNGRIRYRCDVVNIPLMPYFEALRRLTAILSIQQSKLETAREFARCQHAYDDLIASYMKEPVNG